MARRRAVARRRLYGRRKMDKRYRGGPMYFMPKIEAGDYTNAIAQIETVTQADELIDHLQFESKKTQSSALKRRLGIAIAATKKRKKQLQTTTPAEKKASSTKKLRELFTTRGNNIVAEEPPIMTTITPVEPSDGDETPKE